MGLLIDSTVLIHAERERLSPVDLVADLADRFGDQELAISVMSAGEMFHGCWRSGSRLPVSDLLIASTALARQDEVVTGNARHFDRIPRLRVRRYD